MVLAPMRSACWTATAACRAQPATARERCARRASSILKALCAVALASRSTSRPRCIEAGLVGGLAAQRRFGLRRAPRLVRDAAQREARLADDCRRRSRAPRRPRPARRRRTADREFSDRCSSRRSLSRGRSIAMIISSGSRLVSSCGVSPGRRWKSANGDRRARRAGPATWTAASSAASATHMSDGCVAMQCSLVPKMAWMRLSPSIAEQPLPGSRLLQGVATS